MATSNDKHFRIKNGLKVGDVIVIADDGTIDASLITNGDGVSLSAYQLTTSANLESLSASLGTYVDSASISNLIVNVKEEVSSLKLSTLSHEDAASAANLATLQSKSGANAAVITISGYESNALNSKFSASASKVSASSTKAAIELIESSSNTIKQSISSLKLTACSAKLSTSAFKLSASTAKKAVDDNKSAAQVAKQAVLDNKSAASVAKQTTLDNKSAAQVAKFSTSAFKLSASTAKKAVDDNKSAAQVAKQATLDNKSAANLARISASSFKQSASDSASVANVYAGDATSSQQTASGAVVSAASYAGQALTSASAASASKVAAETYSQSALTYKQNASSYKVTACAAKTTALNHQGSACASKLSASGYAASALTIKQDASGYKLSACSSKGTALNHQKSACASKLTASGYAASALTIKQDASGYKVSACSFKNTALDHQGSACAAKLTASAYAASALTIKQDASGYKVSSCSFKATALNHKKSACASKLSASGYAASALEISETASGYKLSACAVKSTALSHQASACAAKLSASGYAASALTIKQDASSHQLSSCQIKATVLEYKKTACARKLAAESISQSALNIKETTSGYKLSACSSKGTSLNHKKSACASKLSASGYAASALLISESASGYELESFNHKQTSLSHQGSACAAKLSASGYAASALTIKEDASGYKVSACSSKGTALNHKTSACASKLSASGYAASALTIKDDASGYKVSACSFKGTALSHRKSACASKLSASGYAASALTIKETTSGYKLSACSSKGTALSHQGSACASKLSASGYAASALTIKQNASSYKVSSCSFKTTALNHKTSACASKLSASGYAASALTIKEDASGYEAAAFSSKQNALTYESSACASKLSASGYAASALTIKQDASGYKVSACSFKNTALDHKTSACASKLSASAITASTLQIKETISGYKLSSCTLKTTALNHQKSACASKLTASSYAASALTIKEDASGYKASACQLKGTTLQYKQTACARKLSASAITASALQIKETISGYKLSSSSFKSTALGHQASACAAKLTASAYAASALTIKEDASGYKVSACQLKATTLQHKQTACARKLSASAITASALQIKETISGYKLSSSSFKSTALSHQASACAAKLTASSYAASALTIKEDASGYKVSACQLKATVLEHKQTACARKLSASAITASALQIKETISGYKLSSSSFKSTALGHQASACAAKLSASAYSASALTLKEDASGYKVTACQLKATVLEHKQTACARKLSASAITASALQIKETISGYKLSSSSFKSTALSHQASACAAKLSASAYSASALTLKENASGYKVTACQLKATVLEHKQTACARKLSASAITASALQIKETISGYKLSSSSFKSTALGHQASACAAKLSASAYSASALTLKEDASGYKVTACQLKATVLQHKQTACARKLSASAITASALQIKETISGYKLSSSSFKTTALNHQKSACASKLTASGYAASALTIKETTSGYMATANTRKGTALTHKKSACASKLTASGYAASALTIKEDASGYMATANTRKNTALTHKKSACASKLTASGYAASALTIKETTSGYKLSACSSKGVALTYKSSACASKLSAQDFEDDALEAKHTASGYMISSQNIANTALTFSDTVSGTVVAINAHKESASVAAGQLGDLASNVQDIRALEASLLTGANGHYTDNAWYIRDLVDSEVTALEDGGIILADEYRSNNVLTDPMARMDITGGSPTSKMYYDGYTGNSQTYTNDNQRVRVSRSGTGTIYIQRDIAQVVQSGVSYTVTAEISGHDTAITNTKIGLGSTSLQQNGGSAFNYFSHTKTSGFPSGTKKFTITATGTPTAGSAYINMTLYGPGLDTVCIDNVTLHKTSETPWGYTKYQTLTLKDSTVAFDKYDIMDQFNAIDGYSGSNLGEKAHFYKIYSTAPIVVSSRAMLATPENWAGHVMGFVRTRDHEQKVDLISPFANASVKVYASRENSAIFKEGITSPIETIYLKQGEPYEWDTSSTRDTWADFDPDVDSRINVVFVSNSRITGFVRGRNTSTASYETDQTPLARLTNEETLNTVSAKSYQFPRWITGGGINVEALRQAIKLHGEGQLVGQGTDTSALNTILGTLKPGQSYPWGNVVDNNFANWNDSSFTVLGYYINGDSREVTKENYDRIDALIDHLDDSYESLKDCSFERNSTSYSLYNAEPETNTNVTTVDGGPSLDVSIDDEANEAQIAGTYFTASSFRTMFMTTAIGDGAGGDAQIGVPRASLSDYYVFPRQSITNVQLVAVEPLSVQIMEKDGDVIATWETPLDVSESKPASFLFGDKDGAGPNLGNNAVGPFRIVGTAPFFCICQNTASDEHTMLGARQAKLSSRSQVSAVATQALSLKSQVDSLQTTVTQEAATIDGLQGRYTVKIDNNNHISGFGLASTANTDGSICSAFVVRADRFAIVSPSSVSSDLITAPEDILRPFEVDASTGQTIIRSAFIKELGSENIRGGSITGDSINATTTIEVYQTAEDGSIIQDSYAAMDGADESYRFYVGNTNPVNAPFSIQTGGQTRASRLRLYGPEGIYFDSTQGMGSAALSEIRDYLNKGLILSKNETFSLSNLGYSDATHTIVLTDSGSNVWQLIKYEIGQIASRYVTDYFATEAYPAVVDFGNVDAYNNSNVSKNYSHVTYPVSNYVDGVRTTTYETGLTRAFRDGELIRLEWTEGTMASGATITTNAQLIEKETQSNLNGTSIGNGSSYSNHIVLQVVKNGTATMAVTITRANGRTLKLVFSSYNSSRPLDNPLQYNPWPLNAVPDKIYLKPMWQTAALGETFQPIFAGGQYSGIGFNDSGEYILEGKVDNWTSDDNDDSKKYRIRQRSSGFAYGQAFSSYEIENGEYNQRLGAVREDGHAHIWTSTFLHNFPKGVYEFKLDVQLEKVGQISKRDFTAWENEDIFGVKSNTLPNTSNYNTDVTLFDALSGTDSTPPVDRVIIRKYQTSDTTGARIDSRIENGIRDYASAYGFGTESNSFTQILHLADVEDNAVNGLWGSGNNHRSDSVIFLGGVSNESQFDAPNQDLEDRDNLFVVALTEFDNTNAQMAWRKKLHLTADGRMYVGTNVTGTEANGWQASPLDRVATMDLAYPVGSIYITYASDFNPNADGNHFPGSWELLPKGRFLANRDANKTDMNSAGETGGSNSVTLTTAQMPSHSHVTNIRLESSAAVVSGYSTTVTNGDTVDHLNKHRANSSKTTNTGGGDPHENRPPYYIVYMWRRTA